MALACSTLADEVGLAQLLGGDVHADVDVAARGRQDRGRVAGCLLEDHVAERHHEAGLLGHPDEHVRRYVDPVGLPPGERLDPGDVARRGTHDGLVDQRQVAGRHGGTQRLDELEALQPGATDRAFVLDPLVLAAGLRFVHREVRVAEHALGRLAAVAERDADARRQRELVAGDVRTAGERREDPVAGLADLRRVHVLEEQRELVTAQAGDGVALPDAVLQPLGDVDQHRVAGGVPEAVVDRLEAVEVDEQQRDAGAAPPGDLQGVLDPVEQQAAVGEVGEQVVARQVGHVLGQPQPGERVGGDRDHRLEGLLVGGGRRPGAVLPRRDDPAVALAVAQLGADLVGAGRGRRGPPPA